MKITIRILKKKKNNKINNENISKKQINYYKCNLFNNLNKLNFEDKKTSDKTNKYRNDKYKICKNISFSLHPNFNNYFKCNKKIINVSNYKNENLLNLIKEVINIQNDIIYKSKEKQKKLEKEINLKMYEIKQLKEYYIKFIYSVIKENNNTLDKIKKYIKTLKKCNESDIIYYIIKFNRFVLILLY